MPKEMPVNQTGKKEITNLLLVLDLFITVQHCVQYCFNH